MLLGARSPILPFLLIPFEYFYGRSNLYKITVQGLLEKSKKINNVIMMDTVMRKKKMAQKDVMVAYILWFFLGGFGVHRLYLDQPVWFIVYLLTGALCGIGWLVDMCLIPCKCVIWICV